MDLNVLIEYIYDVVQSFLLIVFVWYNRKVTWQLYYLVLFQLFMTAGFVFNTYLFQIDPSNNVYPMNPFERMLFSIVIISWIVGLTFFFFMLEEMNDVRLNSKHLFIIIALSVACVVNLLNLNVSSRVPWFFYCLMQISVVAIAGWTFFRIFLKTRELVALLFVVVFSCLVVGTLTEAIDAMFVIFIGIATHFADYGDFISAAAQLLAVYLYARHTNYVIRLPDDHYLLMVTYKNGIAIQVVQLQAHNPITIESDLVSGFISALNSIFAETLQSTKNIETITNEDAMIMMQSTNELVGIVIGAKPTTMLRRSLHRYLQEFDRQFHDLIQNNCTETSQFRISKELLAKVFPFFIIKKIE